MNLEKLDVVTCSMLEKMDGRVKGELNMVGGWAVVDGGLGLAMVSWAFLHFVNLGDLKEIYLDTY